MIRPPLFALLLIVCTTASLAQGQIGIGGQIGEPTGLTLKLATPFTTFDAAAEWDFGDYIFVQGHVILSERRVPGTSADVRYFYGPGVFLGANDSADTAFGLSGNLGVSYYSGAIEIFAQVTPRMGLVPDSKFDVGGAAGLRFYP